MNKKPGEGGAQIRQTDVENLFSLDPLKAAMNNDRSPFEQIGKAVIRKIEISNADSFELDAQQKKR